jgi:hypothetical protein
MNSETGTLPFTYDYPAFCLEMTNSTNIDNIGPGGVMMLRGVLLAFKQIGEIAIRENHQELIDILIIMGILEE